MNEQDEGSLVVKTVLPAHGREYLREESIDCAALGIVNDGWLASGMRLLCSASLKSPIPRDYIWCINLSIKILSCLPEISKVINLRLEIIKAVDLRKLFTALEDALLRDKKYSAEVKKKTSANFRNFSFKYGIQNHKTVNVSSVRYKTKLGSLKSPPKKLLNEPKENEHQEHIGAISHQSYEDLINKTLTKLESDLQTIINACLSDIRTTKILRAHVTEARSKYVPKLYLDYISRFVTKFATTSLDHRQYKNIPEKFRLPSYLQVLDGCNAHNWGVSWRSYDLASLLDREFTDAHRKYPPRQIMALEHRSCTIEIQAIFILLLCRTGWNSSSLYNMELNMIIKTDDHYELQGFKSKTDDFTPSVFIEKREREYYDAVTRLLWNREQLIKLGFIPATEQRLWFAWNTDSRKHINQSVQIILTTKSFTDRHGIFQFSFDQIRTQVGNIAQCSLRSTSEIKILYGHKQLSTTGHYLDQIINSKIYSSMNLEFQRRLESKIIFNMSQSSNNSLIPIGDGASCVNPLLHPFQDIMGIGPCNAELCHIGEGCTNRRLLITEERISELIKTRNYYKEKWKQLYTENPLKFKQKTAFRIIFTNTLYDFINSSAYGYVLRRIEEVLNEQ